MAQPIATTTGICFAFPDVLNTPSGPSMVPMPYPNIAQLSAAGDVAGNVNAGGKPVVLKGSSIDSSSGGEAGTGKAASNGAQLGACIFGSASATVKANGQGIVRQGDSTAQNCLSKTDSSGNAVGQVMVGLPTVLVGG
ncbi:hypothetical protein GCM10009715_10660 [Paeniglutamicibacter psychrophenolicus]|uniref:Zn-binding protein involved in type VI secretion n=1 Tax=Paeniglutamicibacter psychrophenolicus TaxID=257454 RepID=A0ABS4WG36_9MICC|nr:PAAR-like domain-containing protein [Paeniglutamicibacter psychrophenolicus]MBP2375166.1 putative Zn-binding protein involved in type VI secretion [Paeniglutamicibacter psychrophenolicus]